MMLNTCRTDLTDSLPLSHLTSLFPPNPPHVWSLDDTDSVATPR